MSFARALAGCVAAAVLTAACGHPQAASARQPLTPAAASHAAAAFAALMQQYYQGGKFQGAGYWQNAQGFWVILDEYQATHDASLKTDIAEVYLANSQGTFGNYDTLYVDDEGWWALDWIRAWDLTGDPAYLATAKTIFQSMAATWDSTCGGGVWWNHTKTYKNAIPNELFLLVADELHEVTPGDAGTGSYIWWAQREATWFQSSGMINLAGQVNDGLTASCMNNGGNPWTYNQGVILAGMSELYHITGDKAYLQLAEKIATAETRYGTDANGVLQEKGCSSTTSCGGDGPLFKGIFIRYLWWLYHYDPNPAYLKLINTSLNSLWANDRTANGLFGLDWAGPTPPASEIIVEDDIAATMALTSVSVQSPTPPRVGPKA